MSKPLASIVLPIYNQRDHIGSAVGEYLEALARLPSIEHEIVLVPNGATDGSEEVCAVLAAEHPAVRTIAVDEPGWGRAVKAGLREATGSILCYTNSARTTADILSLLLVYASVYPNVVVKANRRIRESWRRRLGSVLYNLECRALFDLATWDINGTPKVFPRKFGRLLEVRRDDDLFDAEFVWICRQEGYPIVEVPILASVRRGGKSTTGYRSALRMYRGAWQLRRRVA
jgi:glycosyltransferase involved in cell wall biosynthesis